MENIKKRRLTALSIEQVCEFYVRALLSVLIIVLLSTMSWMLYKTIVSIVALLPAGTIKDLSIIIVLNTLFLLAMLELVKTALIYISDGRVKVTYIIDTVIIGVLAEVKGFWFREFDYHRLIVVIALLMTLIVARILAIKFSPSGDE